MRILVVGAGIIGLCTAWALARDGHEVTVLEQGPVPNPNGSSVDFHRLIRYAYGDRLGYTRMVGEAHADWERLWSDLGERLYVRTGTLLTRSEGAVLVSDTAASFDRLGIPYELLTGAEMASRFPVFTGEGVGQALYSPTGGALLADRIVAALGRHLPGRGVAIRTGTRVCAIDPERARVVLEGGESLVADRVVVAAGPWIGRLLPAYGGRVAPSRQTVAYLQPPPHLVAAWRKSPMLLDSSGGIGFYLVPPVADTPLKTGDHGFTLTGDPDEAREVETAAAQRVAAAARRQLRDFEAYALRGGRACFYTVEPAERFIVEPFGRAWVATGFSGHGFKFGPAIGRAIADAVAGRRAAAAVTQWAAGLAEPAASTPLPAF